MEKMAGVVKMAAAHPDFVLFLAALIIGFALPLLTMPAKGGGRKHGLRTGRFKGKDRDIDRRLGKEYRDSVWEDRIKRPSEEDGVEHHSSKKYK